VTVEPLKITLDGPDNIEPGVPTPITATLTPAIKTTLQWSSYPAKIVNISSSGPTTGNIIGLVAGQQTNITAARWGTIR